jgi:hypothetical protein
MRPLHPRRPRALGVDFGRVIMSPADGDGAPDTRFLVMPEADAVAIAPPPDAFAVLAGLVRLFEGRVWVVSKAGPRIQGLTRRWLEHHQFHERTGVARDAVRFCRERKEKRVHAEKLRLTHFIDDRVDVLAHLTGVVPHRYLFGPQAQVPAWAVHVADWAAVRAALLGPSAADL